ncbi:MAG: Crp/Fnr family transcriptional regulator [Bacteroidota bacterium]
MIIPEDLLLAHGATTMEYPKGVAIFDRGEEAINYYQVKNGEVKMVNYSQEGQEFVQGFFKKGDSFGEPPIFGNFTYPASAVAAQRSKIFKLRKRHFFELLEAHFEIHKKFNRILSNRLRYKGMMLSEISSHSPEHRIRTLLSFLKDQIALESEFEIPYTRQQIADMTGLRVETVIRTIKKMESDGNLKILNHKIVF